MFDKNKIKVYNSLTNSLEDFKTLKENEVSMYYSEDGKNYTKTASHQFDKLNDAQVALGLSSFWGGGFMIEISDISVNELSVIYTDKKSA